MRASPFFTRSGAQACLATFLCDILTKRLSVLRPLQPCSPLFVGLGAHCCASLQVAALGLWSNYSNSHKHALHPRECPAVLSAAAVAAALKEALPDGYCRRLKLSSAEVLGNKCDCSSTNS